jgi:hypothetical protein
MVANNHSKKQLILDCCEKAQLDRVGAREIRAVEAEVRRRFGPTNGVSASYIANVLRRAGKRVEYNDRFVDPWMEEPYASRLRGLLKFTDLKSAEDSLQKLDTVYREYREKADREGTHLIRTLVLRGRDRAKSLASNPRVNPQKRQEKDEIAFWFNVWVDNVDLFFDWLEIRKQSEDFQKRFSNHDGHH